jgi:hypothetical protein
MAGGLGVTVAARRGCSLPPTWSRSPAVQPWSTTPHQGPDTPCQTFSLAMLLLRCHVSIAKPRNHSVTLIQPNGLWIFLQSQAVIQFPLKPNCPTVSFTKFVIILHFPQILLEFWWQSSTVVLLFLQRPLYYYIVLLLLFCFFLQRPAVILFALQGPTHFVIHAQPSSFAKPSFLGLFFDTHLSLFYSGEAQIRYC